jgi:uncharacterized RDD family membrane protein YckC
MIVGNIWDYSEQMPPIITAVLYIILALSGYVYRILLHGFFGMTIGKMLFKVTVVDVSEKSRLKMSQAFRRDMIPLFLSSFYIITKFFYILETGNPHLAAVATMGVSYWAISAVNSIWFWGEFITMLTNRKRRAIHDFIAGSVVIRIQDVGKQIKG